MSKDKILDMYNDANKISKDINEKEDYVKKRKEERRKILERYRIESVNRVLDFIRSEYRAGRKVDIEILLCHCQNKLYGNIDGVELDLKAGME